MTTVPSLQIPDTREAKFQLIHALAAQPELLPPVYILSHKRASNFTTLKNFPWLVEEATVVVAHTEEAEYRRLWPQVELLVIPPGYGGHDIGLGRALQYILEVADLIGQNHIITVHDDLQAIRVLYPTGVNPVQASEAWVKHVTDRDAFQRGVLTMFALCAAEAYEVHPRAVIASPQVNNATRKTPQSSKRWELNSGGNPAQLQSWHVDRYLDQVGPLNLEDFNFHGEDISLACDVSQAGCDIVSIPSITTGWLDYETQSVIRDADTAPALRQGEHDALMRKGEFTRYIKTRYDIIGRPQWHTLDWAALKRDCQARHDVTLWSDPVRGEL